MIDRRHIGALDVISVLMFSVFASFLVSEDALRGSIFEVNSIYRGCLLLLASLVFYFTVDALKKMDAEAIREYDMEMDVAKKAADPIDTRYRRFYSQKKHRVTASFVLSLLLFSAFFVFHPARDFVIARVNVGTETAGSETILDVVDTTLDTEAAEAAE